MYHIYIYIYMYIYILCRITIIKSEVWTIFHCLELGHETVVCAECLSIFLRYWTSTISVWCMHYSTTIILANSLRYYKLTVRNKCKQQIKRLFLIWMLHDIRYCLQTNVVNLCMVILIELSNSVPDALSRQQASLISVNLRLLVGLETIVTEANLS